MGFLCSRLWNRSRLLREFQVRVGRQISAPHVLVATQYRRDREFLLRPIDVTDRHSGVRSDEVAKALKSNRSSSNTPYCFPIPLISSRQTRSRLSRNRWYRGPSIGTPNSSTL